MISVGGPSWPHDSLCVEQSGPRQKRVGQSSRMPSHQRHLSSPFHLQSTVLVDIKNVRLHGCTCSSFNQRCNRIRRYDMLMLALIFVGGGGDGDFVVLGCSWGGG